MMPDYAVRTAFQAEYEGSIPSTRSKNDLKDLARSSELLF
jgi:hypothetical protein